MKTVVVGLSGGVDSSVTAYLLKEAGYHVIGLFMKNWDQEGDCPWVKEYEDALQVASQLEIACYTINFSQEYWDRVFSYCLRQFKKGHTPNPDILCNQEIKFKLFFEKAMELGADFMATGHYAQNSVVDGKHHLARGKDDSKDQSYFLYTLKERVLQRVLFPLGALPKTEVRRIAKEQGLITAEKKDSVGICFIGKRNFKEFISRYLPKKSGNFETLSGKVVGSHDGVHCYTVGQRRGLDIGGAGAAWYVVGKDVERGVVFVEQGEEHAALYHEALIAFETSWVVEAPEFPLHCTAKIRYRSADVACTVEQLEDGRLHVLFKEPQKAITPHQSIVFYKEDLCLGGAFILNSI